MRSLSKTWLKTFLILATLFVLTELGLKALGRYMLEKNYSHTSSPAHREGDINILCIGESTTVGLWVKPEESYPKQLERLLREEFGSQSVNAIVPPHIGQNTSQQANRIEDYLDRYRPELVVLMSGANNEWSLGESHIDRFVTLGSFDSFLLRLRMVADRSSVFKALRHAYRRILEISGDKFDQENKDAVWGHPEKTKWPPQAEVTDFARKNTAAFVKLWRADLESMIAAAQKRSIPVIVMTYPITPSYLSVGDFKTLAQQTGSTFVDNDETFSKLKLEGTAAAHFERDGWHPSAKGYSLVAENVKTAIVERELLEISSGTMSIRESSESE